ncbi:MAG: MFS transporter [Gammaproteobacteria bacterium]
MIDWTDYSRSLPSAQFILLNLALGVGHFLVLLNAGAYLPMLPNIAGTLGEGVPYAVWGQSNYFVMMGAAMLITRPLIRKWGVKNIALFAYFTFGTASAAVLLALPYYQLVTIARMAQGFAAGTSIIASFILLRESFQESKQQIAITLWSLALFIPFSVGPIVGGFFAYIEDDWRLLFVVSTLVSYFVTGVLWALLADRQDVPDRPYSVSGHLWLFIVFCAAALTFQQFFNIGIISDISNRWSTHWWIFAAFSGFAWLFWVLNNAAKAPLVDLSLFKYPNYAFGTLILCLAFLCFQGSIVEYVLRLELVEGFTPWHAGLVFLPLFIFSKPLSIWAQHKIHHGHDPRQYACLSFLGFALSYWWLGGYMRPASWESLLWPQFLEGAALGLLFVPMTSISLSNIPETSQLHAIDVLNTARNLSAGLIIAFADTIWDRINAHQRNHLVSLGAGDAERFVMTLPKFVTAPAAATHHLLAVKIGIQSGLLTLNTLFNSLALVFFAFALLIWFASPLHPVHADPILDQIVESLGEEP